MVVLLFLLAAVVDARMVYLNVREEPHCILRLHQRKVLHNKTIPSPKGALSEDSIPLVLLEANEDGSFDSVGMFRGWSHW